MTVTWYSLSPAQAANYTVGDRVMCRIPGIENDRAIVREVDYDTGRLGVSAPTDVDILAWKLGEADHWVRLAKEILIS